MKTWYNEKHRLFYFKCWVPHPRFWPCIKGISQRETICFQHPACLWATPYASSNRAIVIAGGIISFVRLSFALLNVVSFYCYVHSVLSFLYLSYALVFILHPAIFHFNSFATSISLRVRMYVCAFLRSPVNVLSWTFGSNIWPNAFYVQSIVHHTDCSRHYLRIPIDTC